MILDQKLIHRELVTGIAKRKIVADDISQVCRMDFRSLFQLKNRSLGGRKEGDIRGYGIDSLDRNRVPGYLQRTCLGQGHTIQGAHLN